MIPNRYVKGQPYDEMFGKNILPTIKEVCNHMNDDYLLLLIGTTGSGKTMFALHAVDDYLGDDADIKYIALNRGEFADALYEAKSKPLPRVCVNDEANISKRDALSQYNKDVLNTYYAIRGLNIFHIWCNPSVDMIDKPFIEDRIKGMILITTKDTKRPRVYYFFRKKDLLKIYDRYKNLKLRTIRKVRRHYAYYKGCFTDYTGRLLTPYLQKKGERMSQHIDDFKEKYGTTDKMLTSGQVCKDLGISAGTLKNYINELTTSGQLKEGKHYYLNAARRYHFTKEALPKFKEIAQIRFNRQMRMET